MNLKRISFIAEVILYTMIILFIGSYFSLDLPISVLMLTLLKGLIVALPAGIVGTYLNRKYLNKIGPVKE